MTSQKNSLEIELNESLRRRRGTLNNQLSSFGNLDSSDSMVVGDLDAQTSEAASLRSAIADLTASIESKSALELSIISLY